jgi:hypothetical protein
LQRRIMMFLWITRSITAIILFSLGYHRHFRYIMWSEAYTSPTNINAAKWTKRYVLDQQSYDKRICSMQQRFQTKKQQDHHQTNYKLFLKWNSNFWDFDRDDNVSTSGTTAFSDNAIDNFLPMPRQDRILSYSSSHGINDNDIYNIIRSFYSSRSCSSSIPRSPDVFALISQSVSETMARHVAFPLSTLKGLTVIILSICLFPLVTNAYDSRFAKSGDALDSIVEVVPSEASNGRQSSRLDTTHDSIHPNYNPRIHYGSRDDLAVFLLSNNDLEEAVDPFVVFAEKLQSSDPINLFSTPSTGPNPEGSRSNEYVNPTSKAARDDANPDSKNGNTIEDALLKSRQKKTIEPRTHG